MANFAKIINNNIVERLVAVSDDELIDENGQENEVLGIAFLKELFGYDTEWVQTSYNNNFRSKFACIELEMHLYHQNQKLILHGC